jgi:hypothetical protein
MREYKMRRGEHLADRLPDLRGTVEEYFGPITDTEEYAGSELHVVGEPDNPVFERIVAGAVDYGSKKDTLAVEFVERPAAEALDDADADPAAAVNAKNSFLREATGRDAKSRRESMKRTVEDDAETPDVD